MCIRYRSYCALIVKNCFSIEEISNFLEINNNYSAVHGLSITITLDDKNYSNIKSANLYKLPTCTQDTALERLNYMTSNYGVANFSVHKSKIFWH